MPAFGRRSGRRHGEAGSAAVLRGAAPPAPPRGSHPSMVAPPGAGGRYEAPRSRPCRPPAMGVRGPVPVRGREPTPPRRGGDGARRPGRAADRPGPVPAAGRRPRGPVPAGVVPVLVGRHAVVSRHRRHAGRGDGRRRRRRRRPWGTVAARRVRRRLDPPPGAGWAAGQPGEGPPQRRAPAARVRAVPGRAGGRRVARPPPVAWPRLAGAHRAGRHGRGVLLLRDGQAGPLGPGLGHNRQRRQRLPRRRPERAPVVPGSGGGARPRRPPDRGRHPRLRAVVRPRAVLAAGPAAVRGRRAGPARGHVARARDRLLGMGRGHPAGADRLDRATAEAPAPPGGTPLRPRRGRADRGAVARPARRRWAGTPAGRGRR